MTKKEFLVLCEQADRIDRVSVVYVNRGVGWFETQLVGYWPKSVWGHSRHRTLYRKPVQFLAAKLAEKACQRQLPKFQKWLEEFKANGEQKLKDKEKLLP